MSVLVAIGILSVFAALTGLYRMSCFGPDCGTTDLLEPEGLVCTQSGQNLVCSLSVANVGNVDREAAGCSIQLGGSSVSGTVGGSAQFPAGSSVNFVCMVRGTEPPLGSEASLSVELNGQSTAVWSGTWS